MRRPAWVARKRAVFGSHKVAWGGIPEWIEWCRAIGAKLLDDTISVREVLRYVLIPVPVTERPRLVPVTIEWPDEFWQRSEEAIGVDVAGDAVPFHEAGLELVDHESHGPLRFRVFTEAKSVEYEMVFSGEGVEFAPVGEETVEFVVGRKREGLLERFREEHPIIWFANGASLMHEMLRPPSVRRDPNPFDKDRIEAWDWGGIDLRKESQNIERRRDSIQYRVIQELLGDDLDYDIIFDDDDTHEAADVVAIKVDGEDLVVHLFHCKHSGGASPGHRVSDLYTVCGQAQRSVPWRDDPGRLMAHLRRREESRLRKHESTRFERGDFTLLDGIARHAPRLIPKFKIFVVQPGLSRSQAETAQLELLAVTEHYLRETRAIELGVIASP